MLTLVVIPVVYTLLDRKRSRPRRAAVTSPEAVPALPAAGWRHEPPAARRQPPVTTLMLLVSRAGPRRRSRWSRLPLAFLPEVDVPFIGIQIPYPNSNPTQVEKEIAKPVEEVLATLPGVKKLRSDLQRRRRRDPHGVRLGQGPRRRPHAGRREDRPGPADAARRASARS